MKLAPPVLVLVLAVSGCAQQTTAGHRATRSPSAGASTSAAPTDADNERAAAAAADRLIAAMSPPAHSVRLEHPPAGWPLTLGQMPGQYVRTRWFSVPGSAADLLAFLSAHPPAGLVRDEGFSMSSGTGAAVQEIDYRDPHASEARPAMAPPEVRVSWQESGSGVVLEYQVLIDARHARPAASLVRGTVRRVVLDRVPPKESAGMAVPRPLHRVVTDPARIAGLVQAANALVGSTITVLALPCPYFPPTAYTIRFSDADGTLTLRWIPFCAGQVNAARNGHDVAVTLDPGRSPSLLDAFNAAVR